MKKRNEHGFAHMALIAVVVVGLGAGLVGLYVAQRTAQSEQANQQQLEAAAAREADELAAKEAEEAKIAEQQKQADEEKEKQSEADATPEPTPTPAPTPAPTPTPQPAPAATPKVTPITASDCNEQRFTAYVANKNGAKGSYRPPSSWQTATSYSYKQSLKVMCNASTPSGYVIGNDDYIKASDLSKTPL